MISMECLHGELNVIQLLLSITFKFLICVVLHCFLYTITRNFMLINLDIRIEGFRCLQVIYEVMASKIEQYTHKKTDSKKSGNEKEEQTKSFSSYLLYIGTIIAVFGAIASTTQVDSLNDFIDEFSTRLCASSIVSGTDEVANETKSVNHELRLSSKFDPLLKDGEAYNALNAIKSR